MTWNRMTGDKPNKCYQKGSKKCTINNAQKQNSRPKVREYFLWIKDTIQKIISHKPSSLKNTAWNYVTSVRNASRNY